MRKSANKKMLKRQKKKDVSNQKVWLKNWVTLKIES